MPGPDTVLPLLNTYYVVVVHTHQRSSPRVTSAQPFHSLQQTRVALLRERLFIPPTSHSRPSIPNGCRGYTPGSKTGMLDDPQLSKGGVRNVIDKSSTNAENLLVH